MEWLLLHDIWKTDSMKTGYPHEKAAGEKENHIPRFPELSFTEEEKQEFSQKSKITEFFWRVYGHRKKYKSIRYIKLAVIYCG